MLVSVASNSTFTLNTFTCYNTFSVCCQLLYKPSTSRCRPTNTLSQHICEVLQGRHNASLALPRSDLCHLSPTMVHNRPFGKPLHVPVGEQQGEKDQGGKIHEERQGDNLVRASSNHLNRLFGVNTNPSVQSSSFSADHRSYLNTQPFPTQHERSSQMRPLADYDESPARLKRSRPESLSSASSDTYEDDKHPLSQKDRVEPSHAKRHQLSASLGTIGTDVRSNFSSHSSRSVVMIRLQTARSF